jgi:hypothetical protein
LQALENQTLAHRPLPSTGQPRREKKPRAEKADEDPDPRTDAEALGRDDTQGPLQSQEKTKRCDGPVTQ